MEKYSTISALDRGSFNDRLCQVYMKLGDYTDFEMLENRTLRHVKVFLSDAINQHQALLESQLWHDYLSKVPCSVVGQAPLNGSKITLLVKTSDEQDAFTMHSIRLGSDEAKGMAAGQQTKALFAKYTEALGKQGLNLAQHCVRTWVYVDDIDNDYKAVSDARNELFAANGLTPDTHFIASTGIGGCTGEVGVHVGIDFLSCPDITEDNIKYLTAPTHLNPTHEYGVAFERGARVSIGAKQVFFISGTASIDNKGQVVYPGDVAKQTGRLLENIGALLADGDARMNDIRYFTVYLRDLSDYATVDKLMATVFPYTPRIIVEAKVCRPEWLVEMECVAIKES